MKIKSLCDAFRDYLSGSVNIFFKIIIMYKSYPMMWLHPSMRSNYNYKNATTIQSHLFTKSSNSKTFTGKPESSYITVIIIIIVIIC